MGSKDDSRPPSVFSKTDHDTDEEHTGSMHEKARDEGLEIHTPHRHDAAHRHHKYKQADIYGDGELKGDNKSQPDLGHDEIEAMAPGHELDIELGKGINDFEKLAKAETRTSVKSKISRVISAVSRRSKKERMHHEPIPTTNLDEGVVGWDSQDDPAMPFNFPRKQKWLIVGLLSTATFVTPFASSIMAPGIGDVMQDFNITNTTIGALSVSIYLLGYVIGPLFMAPLSEIYGRKIVLGLSNAFFCAWQIGCALAPNVAALTVFRLLAGVGGAGCLTLGGGVIADVFRTDERGFAMGIYTLGPLIGPTVGPLIGGFVAENAGWRWDFWIVLIVGVLVTILTEIFNTETNPRVLIQRKVLRMQQELGRDDLRSCYVTAELAASKPTKGRILRQGLVRPFKLLFLSPQVFSTSLYIAFAYGVLYLLFTTITDVFQNVYGFSVGTAGLVYLCLGIGFLTGWSIITATSDKSVVRMARANGGKFEPEMRLFSSIIFGTFLPVTFFWYGWTAYYRVHWIVPIISLFPFAMGIMGLFLPMITYLVDCYPMYAASAVAANTVFRSLVGALLPLAGPKMYESLGLGWGNSLLGFICVAMIPIPLLLYRYGGVLRKHATITL